MSRIPSLALLFAGLVAVSLAGPVLGADQDKTETQATQPTMGQKMGMGCMMGGGADMMLERIDGRLAFIKAELKIRDDQSDAWTEFADAVKATAKKHNAMMRQHMEEMRSGEVAKKPLPERLEQQETHLAAHLEQIKAMREALGKLYAVLDDKQKEEASEIVLPMMGMDGMGMVMGRGMRGMMEQGGMIHDRGMMGGQSMMGGQGMTGQGGTRHGPGMGSMMGR